MFSTGLTIRKAQKHQQKKEKKDKLEQGKLQLHHCYAFKID